MGNALDDGRVDGHLGHVAEHAEIVVPVAVFRERASGGLHGTGRLHGAEPVLAHATHGLRIAGEAGNGAHVVQDVLGGDGLGPHAAFGKGNVRRHVVVQVVADHDHVEEFGLRIDAKGQGRVGGAGQDVGIGHGLDDIRGMTAARAFRVIGVDDTAFHGGDGIFHIAGFVQRIRMDGDLHVHLVGHGKSMAYHGRHGAPVLMDLEAAGARFYLLAQGLGSAGMALGQQAHVHGHILGGLEHTMDIPLAGGDGRAVSAVSRANAAAEESGHTVGNSGLALLGRNEVHMGVDTASCEDEVFAGNGVRGVAHHEFGVHAFHDAGVPRLAYADNHAVADAHIGLDDALHGVDNGHVGDDDIQHAVIAAAARIAAHAGTQGFAAAVDGFIAVTTQILFDFYEEVSVSKADAVAHGRAEQGRILFSRNLRHGPSSVPDILEAEGIGLSDIDGAAMGIASPRIHKVIEAVHGTEAAKGHELHGLFIAGFETHRRSGSDVQAHTVGRGTVEFQSAVHLEEMEMRTHLNGPVAGVAHLDLDHGPAFIERNGRIGKNNAAHGYFFLIVQELLLLSPQYCRG